MIVHFSPRPERKYLSRPSPSPWREADAPDGFRDAAAPARAIWRFMVGRRCASFLR